MSNKKINNLVNQLSPSEQKQLEEYLEIQYAVNFSEEQRMYRDDIKDRVIELLTAISWKEVKEESLLEKELELDTVDLAGFSETLLEEYDLEEIEFSALMEWTTVKDIVDYIEIALQNKVGE